MKSKSLWKRILGKLSDRKANAQVAFQDQFDTRLQFRELEPRVVLAADAVYDAMNQTLTITVEDGDSVEIGRNGMDNFLYVSGLDSSSGDGTFMGGKLTLDTATLNTITITDTNINNSLDPSTVAFLATLADGPDLGLTTGNTSLENVDSVSIDVGAEIRVGGFEILSSGANTDDSNIDIAGAIIGDVNVDVTNTSAKTLDVTSTDQGSVTGSSFTINRVATAGAVGIDLSQGTHDLDSLAQVSASEEVSIALTDVDEIELGNINASSLNVEAGGSIQDTATTKIKVSSAASLEGTEITLDNSVAGHDFNTLTLNTSAGSASVAETDGFDFVGVSDVAGALRIESGGAIGQIGGSKLVTGNVNIDVVGQNVILDGAKNDFGGSVDIDANEVWLTDVGGIELGEISASKLTVESGGFMIQTGGEKIVVTGETNLLGDDLVLLENMGNNFGGAVNVEGSLVGLRDVDSFQFGTISTGAFSLIAGGPVTQSGTSTINAAAMYVTATGQDVTLTGGNNDFGAYVGAEGKNVSLTSSGAMALSNVSATTLIINAGGDVTQAVPSNITASDIQVNAAGHAITLDHAGNDFTGSVDAKGTVVSLTDANAIDLGVISASSLAVVAGGAVTQTGGENLVVSGDASITATGNMITLGSVANDIGGAVDATGTDLFLADSNGIQLRQISVTSLVLVSGGPITQTGTSMITATSSQLNAVGQDITLTGNNNDFGSSLFANGKNVSLTDGGAVHLIDISADTFTLNTGGAVTQNAATSISAGNTQINAAGHAITLESGSNNFKGSVDATGTDIVLHDANAIELGEISASMLSVEAGGAVTQTDGESIVVTSATEIKTTGHAVTLTNATNDFGGSIDVVGNNVMLTDVSKIELGEIAASTLTVTAGGDVTQTAGEKIVAGDTTISAAGKSITLDNATNDFTGSFAATGTTIDVEDSNALQLGDISATDLYVTTSGTITQTTNKAIVVGDTVFFSALSSDITVANSGNDFQGLVQVLGKGVAIRDANSISLGSITVFDGFSIQAGDEITQAAPSLAIFGGQTTLIAGGAITLELVNSFLGTIHASGTDVSINNLSTLVLGDITADSLNVASIGGSIFQDRGTKLDIAGETFVSVEYGSVVFLTNANNDFSGMVSVTSLVTPGGVRLRDINEISLGNIKASSLEVRAGGNIEQFTGTTLAVTTTTEITIANGFNVTLFNSGNQLKEAISVSGIDPADTPNAVKIHNEQALLLGDIEADLLEVQSETGTIMQDGGTSLDIATTTTARVSDGQAVTLNNSGNDFSDAVSIVGITGADTPGAVTLHDVSEIVLGNIDAQSLNVAAGKHVSQEIGTSLDVETTTDIFVGDGANVTLFNSGNDFIGTVSIDGVGGLDVPSQVKLQDTNSILLGNIEAVSLEVLAGGTITQLGGTNLGAPIISLTSGDAITLGDVTSTKLNISAGGAVDQDGGTALAISGITTVAVDDGFSVTLFNPNNDFGGAVSVLGNSPLDVPAEVLLKDKNAILLGDITADSLTIMAGGKVSQDGGTMLDIETTTDVMTANGFDVLLNNNTNDFDGAVSVAGNVLADLLNQVSITDSNALILGDIRAAKLNVIAGGGLDQDLTKTIQSGETTIEVADGKSVTLFNAGNDFTGPVSITTPGLGVPTAVKLQDASALELGNIEANTLQIQAASNVTQDVMTTLQVAAQTIVRVGDTAHVTLNNAGNDFVGSISVAGILGTDDPGEVKINDANALLLAGIVADSLELHAAGDITQEVSTSLDVETKTTITTDDGFLVNLSNAGNDFRGAVSVTGTTATDTPSEVVIRDDAAGLGVALILGEIRTDSLTIHAQGSVEQFAGSKLIVGGDTNVGVADQADVGLGNAGNDFVGLVSVMGIDPAADTPGFVSLRDDFTHGGNIAIMLGNIRSTSLTIEAAGTITQPNDGSTTIVVTTGSTNLTLTAKGDIDLLAGDNDIHTDLGMLETFTVTLPDISHLENFYLRNISTGAILPEGDLLTALAAGNIDNVTLDFEKSPALDLPEIRINEDLIVTIAGDLTQSGNIAVGENASLKAGTLTLANANDVHVADKISLAANLGDIEVGVISTANNAFARGTDAGTKVSFGTVTFSAADFDVTIAEDRPVGDLTPGMNLAGTNVGKSVVLRSAAGIETDAGASLSVADLASFTALNGDIQLGNAVDEMLDLRIVYANANGHVSLHEQNDSNGLAMIDGTQAKLAGGTLAVKTDGPIVQVNDIRTGAPANQTIGGQRALFDSGNGVLLTSLDVDVLAVSAAGSPLFVTPGMSFDLTSAGLSDDNGFGGTLQTDTIDPDLPDENTDPFAAAAQANAFSNGAGEDYSLIAVNQGNLTIAKVADPLGDIGAINGLETNGAAAGHTFVRTTAGGDLTFGAAGTSSIVVDLTNSGVITALAAGKLTISDGFQLHSSKGAGGVGDLFAVVSKIVEFDDMPLPPPNTQYEIDDPASWGPAYARITGTSDTYLLDTSTGEDTEAAFVLTQLGEVGEMDFVLVTDWRFGSNPPDPAVLDFESIIVTPISENIDTPTQFEFVYPWQFATTHASVTILVSAYNSPQINLFENVDAAMPTNLNVVNDSFRMYLKTPIDNVPLITTFAPATRPIVVPPPVELPPQIVTSSLVEVSDESRVLTQIEGVTVVEVDPDNFVNEVGEEIKLDSEFTTLDAVKELIQRDERFPPGVYRITIVYPGVEKPQVIYFEKHLRAIPADIFGQHRPAERAPVVDVAAAKPGQNNLSPEQVWAREYEKWFPAAQVEQANLRDESLEGTKIDPRQGGLPAEDAILLERVSQVDLQEIDRMTQRLRAKHTVQRNALGTAMVGGAFLMAAAASGGPGAAAEPAKTDTENMPPKAEDNDGNRLDRLRRRLRQWL